MKRISHRSADRRNARATYFAAAVLALGSAASVAHAQSTQYFAGDGSALNATKYSSSPTGPFTQGFISGSILGFSVVNGTGIAPTSAMTIGGITATQNFTETTGSSTLSATSVITVNVGQRLYGRSQQRPELHQQLGHGRLANLTGGGVFATAGNTFGGGVTLGGGSTMVARGVNALGSTATNTLVINSGILASTQTNDFSSKFAGGITFGGDFPTRNLSR